MPFEEAAEVGTRKVIRDHSTIGIAVTTDGTIGDIDREAYLGAEERIIRELKELKKPFVVIVNSTEPSGKAASEVVEKLKNKFNVHARAVNCAKMSEATVKEILTDALMQFPASQINFYFPGFVEGLTKEHWIKAAIISGIKDWIKELDNVEQVKQSIGTLEDGQLISGITITNMDLGTGDIDVQVEMVSGLFYKVVEEMMEQPVKNDYEFFELLKEFAASKKAYDKLKDAMVQVEESGYGIVQPKLSEMVLDEPEIFKQGNKYGVCLRAKAPSLHIIKTNISTEISPIVGTEKQSEDLVKYLLTEFESEPSKIWETNIFGKSLQEMVTEQMENKLSNVPDHIRGKVQKSLQKISDEGKDYFICIIL
nr:stage IV sporulation protein A [Aminipila terrae]